MSSVSAWLTQIQERSGFAEQQDRNSINKDTPLSSVERMFMSTRRGRGNTAGTMKYYRGIWSKIYTFLSYMVSGDPRAHTKDEMSILPLEAILFSNLQENYRTFMRDVERVSPQTISSHMRGLRAIMGFIKENSNEGVVSIYVKDTEPPIKSVFTDAELEALSIKPDPKDFIAYRGWMITRYTMATGNRAGSISSLKVGDIDLDEGFVIVSNTKNKHPDRLPLVRPVIREITEYINLYRTSDTGFPLNDEPLFVTMFGGPMKPNDISRAFKVYCLSRGISKTSIHLLRHTFAKRYITNGGDVLSLKVMLGHRSLKMVNHYARLYGSDIKASVEAHSLISQTKVTHGRKKITPRIK